MTCDVGKEATARLIGWDVYGFWYCPGCSPTNDEIENTSVAMWDDDPAYPADARCCLCGEPLRKGDPNGSDRNL